MKVAVCLTVKDEAIELVYWIAWYTALGFDSFIIYNDNSSDETENVILSLQNIVDIRYMRNAPNYDRSVIRQLRAYNDAIEKYGKEFDWIALFDVDEYLYLDGIGIKEYLSQYQEDVSSVVFNWCCVGTNGFINRPDGAPFFNYIKHGAQELFWNRHTKIILRPQHLTKAIYHVHNAIVSGNCVTSDGELVKWDQGPHGGLTKDSPSWKGGRLFHYQSRSLEHYVKRHVNMEPIRSRSSDPLHNVTNSPEYNVMETKFDPNYIQNYYEVLRELVLAQIYFILEKTTSVPSALIDLLKYTNSSTQVDIFDPVYTPQSHEVAHNWISFCKKRGGLFKDVGGEDIFFFHITDFFDKKLGVKGQKLAVGSDLDADIIAVYIKGSSHLHLFSSSNDYFHVKGDVRVLKAYTYAVWKNHGKRFSLSHSRKNRFLGFTPSGEQTFDRLRACNWESFNYHLISPENVPDHIVEAANFLSIVKNVQIMREYRLLNGNKHMGLYLNVINTLPQNELDAIDYISGNIINEHLY